MNERIDYEKCVSCKWCDPTQAQCYDGHLQNKKGCMSFEQNNSEPTSADLQSAAINLYMLMCRFGAEKMVINFEGGRSFEASSKLLKANNRLPEKEKRND